MAGRKTAKRKSDAGAGIPAKKSKQISTTPSAALYDDPMIDPTDSSGSEDKAEDDMEEDDAEEEDVEEIGDMEEEGEPNDFAQIIEAGPSRPRQKSRYAPPTLDEVDRLRSVAETGNTFTFKLEALLSSTLLPSTPAPRLKSILSRVHDLILSLPALPPLSPQEAAERTQGIPFPGGETWSPLKQDVKWTLGWEKPAEVFVGGSWSVCGGYKKGKGVMGDVDLVVVMPSAMFSPKDRMNYRYFHKRAHYLAVVKAAIEKAMLADEELKGLEVTWKMDDKRPIIVLRAGKGQGLKYAVEIKIHASIPPNTFPPNTIAPSKNLLRISDESTSTPQYATALAHDTIHKPHLLHLHHLSQLLPDREVESFLALWRIWAVRRGISQGASGWFAGMLLGWIVEGGEQGGVGGVRERTKTSRGLGRGLGYWSALRAAWKFLAHTDFAKTPIFMGGGDEAVITSTEFCRASNLVFIDPTRSVNLLAEWEAGEVDLLRYHARETLGMLEDHSVDRFDEVFLRNVGGTAVFDEFIRVDMGDSTYIPAPIAQSEQPSRIHLLAHSVARVLRQGLSDRAKIVHVQPRDDHHLDIGIIYDSQTATRVMDMGPSPDQTTETEAFRALWGDKAELRRFKDGSINESVVWDISRPEDIALIPGWIVDWLLQRHFGVSSSDHISSNPTWLSTIQTPSSARNAICVTGSEKLGFSPIMKAYDELYRLLKSIDPELPLAILNVTPSDEMLRYSSTFIPHPIDAHRYPSAPDCLKHTPSAEVIVQFESSAKWPEDLAAIQKVKLALLEKLARIVNAQLKGAKAEIVFEAETSEIQDHAGLEILLPSGVAFTLRIHHEKERTYLERILTEDAPVFGTSLPRPSRRLAQPALDSYMRRFIHRPTHHAALAPMHHRYPSYSSATRLLKRWFAAHMLSLQIRSEAIELIMAAVYLDPPALSIPASATVGFIRAIERLATWDWKAEPIFVPVFTAAREAATHSTRTRLRFPTELREEATRLFGQMRAKDPEARHSTWGIVTEEDVEGFRWTKDGPSRVVAGRVTGLARATADAIRQANEGASLNVKSLFKTPLHQYDILLHLRPAFLTRYSQAVEPASKEWDDKLKFRNLQDGGVYGGEVKVDFDPAWSFARDVQRFYGDAVLVFFDRHGGSTIGLLFNPTRKAPRGFKPFLGYSTKPVTSESALVELDTEAVVAEITRLGEGLVERVERGMGI